MSILDIIDRAEREVRDVSEKRKYRLVYFKAWNGPRGVGGKYYAEGEYETESPWHDVLDEVEVLQRERRLPGLSSPHSAYHVLVDGEVPHLLLSDVRRAPEGDSMTVTMPTLEHEEPLTDVEQHVLAEQVKAAVEQTLFRVYEVRRQQKRRRDDIKVVFNARKDEGE